MSCNPVRITLFQRWKMGSDDELGTLLHHRRQAAGGRRAGQHARGVHRPRPVTTADRLNTRIRCGTACSSMRLRRFPRWTVSRCAARFAVTHLDAITHVFWRATLQRPHSAELLAPDGLRFGSVHAQRDGIITAGSCLESRRARGAIPDSGRSRHRRGPDRANAWPVPTSPPRRGVRTRRPGAPGSRTGHEDPSVRAGLDPSCLPWPARARGCRVHGDCVEQIPFPARSSHYTAPDRLVAMGAGTARLPSAAELVEVCAELGTAQFLPHRRALRILAGTGSPVNPCACSDRLGGAVRSARCKICGHVVR